MPFPKLRLLAAALLVAGSASAAFAWGAIAVDDDPGDAPGDVGYGSATGYNTQAAARSNAMQACQMDGNAGCAVVVTFQQCGAYASSAGSYGIASAPTQQQAEQNALASCGEAACQVVVSDCN